MDERPPGADDCNYLPINPKEVDALLAAELQQLSVQDREEIQDEIHGIKSLAPTETTELILGALLRLEEEIRTIPNKPAYERALTMSSLYVHDRAFRLKFLRAARYDVKRAAIRFVMYLDIMVEFYGVQALLRPLLFSDLRDEDVELLKEGTLQLLPNRDRFGRRVCCYSNGFGVGYSLAARVRLALYVQGTASSEDEETQINGLAHVYWLTYDQSDTLMDAESRRNIARIADCMPVRVSAIHFCLTGTGPSFYLSRAALLISLPKDVRARSRVHMGPITECCYQLMTFGIPVTDMPVSDSGRLKTKYLMSWIKTRRAMDTAFLEGRTFLGVECPLRQDVLFFNGGRMWSYPGNTAFREILDSKYCWYRQSESRSERRAIIVDIISDVTTRDGRFLSWDASNGWWDILAPDSKALYDRVRVARRDHYKRLKERKLNEQTTKSSTNLFTVHPVMQQQHHNGMLTDDGAAGGCFMVEQIDASGCIPKADVPTLSISPRF